MDKLETVDIETVAAVLRVSERQVRNWVSDAGCPSSKDGRTRMFYWPDVLEWYVEYRLAKQSGVSEDYAGEENQESEDIRAANLRKIQAEANLKELQLSQRRGEVVTIADAKVRLDRMFLNLKTQLLNLPSRVASRSAGLPPNQLEGAVKEEVYQLLRELSTGAIVGASPEPVEEEEDLTMSAAAEPSTELSDAEHDQITGELTKKYEFLPGVGGE